MMNELYDLCENLQDQIKELNKKGDISPTELERAYKAVDIIKDIKTIEAMEEAGSSYDMSYDDYSRRYYRDGGNSYENSNARRGRDGDGDGRYSEEGSYRRGRDAMGRYTSRDGGYSGHEDKEQMMRQIEEMKRKLEKM